MFDISLLLPDLLDILNMAWPTREQTDLMNLLRGIIGAATRCLNGQHPMNTIQRQNKIKVMITLLIKSSKIIEVSEFINSCDLL